MPYPGQDPVGQSGEGCARGWAAPQAVGLVGAPGQAPVTVAVSWPAGGEWPRALLASSTRWRRSCLLPSPGDTFPSPDDSNPAGVHGVARCPGLLGFSTGCAWAYVLARDGPAIVACCDGPGSNPDRGDQPMGGVADSSGRRSADRVGSDAGVVGLAVQQAGPG